VRNDAAASANPECRRDAKRELEKLMLESYKETRHQPKFSALIDLKTASRNSRSFRRMVHAVETLAGLKGGDNFRVSRASPRACRLGVTSAGPVASLVVTSTRSE
jgi:hypothetical protein